MSTRRIRSLSNATSRTWVTLVLILAAWPAASETVFASGSAGGNGPAAGNGGDGESVAASSGPSDPTNRTTVTGGRGGRGGDAGLPRGSGGDGGDGGDASAESSSIQGGGTASATATATGGLAGAGGSAPASGMGRAGEAGEAGDGEAVATISNSGGGGSATATATGGNGAVGSGVGRRGSDGGTATAMAIAEVAAAGIATANVHGGWGGGGSLGADGGDGADASLGDGSAVATTTASDAFIRELQRSTGGRGGSSTGGVAGDGGDATTERTKEGLSGESLTIGLESDGGVGGNATAGGTAGTGGDATSHVRASFEGNVFVSAGSGGGDGGNVSGGPGIAGAGGAAEASAQATSLPLGADARATASATGGNGGSASGVGLRGQDGVAVSEVSAVAMATSTGEATAHVFAGGGDGGTGLFGAEAGDGGDAILENAVHATGQSLDLSQIARGGDGGRVNPSLFDPLGPAGDGGDASSILEAANPLGDIKMELNAHGGWGGGGSGNPVVGGSAGDAHVSAIATAVGDVDVSANAWAGTAGSSGATSSPGVAGASATLGPVYGASTAGGRVEVSGRTFAGNGGESNTRAGDGASATLVDVVDGDTTGTLILGQSASAGDAGSTGLGAAIGAGARGGDAFSRLVRSKSAESLTLEVVSIAGDSSGSDAAGRSMTGGDALTEIVGHNDAGDLIALYRATGGAGATPTDEHATGGQGGAARSVIHATTVGDGQAIRVQPVQQASTGGVGGSHSYQSGLGGGDGGAASTEIKAVAEGDSEVDVRARAVGGSGGRGHGDAAGGDGATGEAHARAQNAGSSAINVLAEATGGYGGFGLTVDGEGLGGTGASADATAFGRSTGGGDVTATARVSGGSGGGVGVAGSAELVDAVAGQTTGRLRLVQEAKGGDRDQGVAGAATSSLRAIDADGGALELESIAQGGDGFAAGAAHASAYGAGEEDVQVVARSFGGAGASSDGAGGGATVGPIYGRSAKGGFVHVEAEVVSGAGSTTDTFARTPGGGRGADALVEDAVDGRTTGILQLVQASIGGDAGEFGMGGTGGAAGSATNRLTRTVSAEALEVNLSSKAGRGSNQRVATPGATDGGVSIAEAELRNDSGGIVVSANSRGGQGGSGQSGQLSGNGGSATLRVAASTTQSGQDVVVGGGIFPAYGASGGSSRASSGGRGTTVGVSGIGGDADSESRGLALGDSVVSVFDRARGGAGFDGGHANSYARGENKGSQQVTVLSLAAGGGSSGAVGRPGDAYATAVGVSIGGAMDARADAQAGRRSFGVSLPIADATRTVAEAQADATGGSGLALAEARGWANGEIGTPGFFGEASAQASVTSTTRVEAIVGRSARAALDSDRDVSAFIGGPGTREGEFARIGLNILAFNEDSVDDPIATANISPNSFSNSPDTLEGVFVSFLDLRIDDENFSEVLFKIENGENGEQSLLERSLTTAEDARVFFSSVIDLGDYDDDLTYFFGLNLYFTLTSSSGGGANLGTYFAVGSTPVPEPGTGLLLVTGLILLAARRNVSG